MANRFGATNKIQDSVWLTGYGKDSSPLVVGKALEIAKWLEAKVDTDAFKSDDGQLMVCGYLGRWGATPSKNRHYWEILVSEVNEQIEIDITYEIDDEEIFWSENVHEYLVKLWLKETLPQHTVSDSKPVENSGPYVSPRERVAFSA
jgi:hypothetical protein